MRKILSLVIGGACLVVGVWSIYGLFFEAAYVKGLFLLGAGFIVFVGAYLIWNTLRDW